MTDIANLRASALQKSAVPIAGRLGLAFLLALAAFTAFLTIAHHVMGSTTHRLDIAISHYFRTRQTPWFHAAATAISLWLGPIGVPATVLFSAIAFHLRKQFLPDGLTMLIAGVGGWGVISALKAAFPRVRPDSAFADLGSSFPSGHSFFAATIYGLLAYWLTRDVGRRARLVIWTIAGVIILLVGFSRVLLGAHYPSDVLAGFCVAVPWIWGCLVIGDFFPHRSAKPNTL